MLPHSACNLTRKPTLTFIVRLQNNIRQHVIDAKGPDGNDRKRKYNKIQEIQGNVSKRRQTIFKSEH